MTVRIFTDASEVEEIDLTAGGSDTVPPPTCDGSFDLGCMRNNQTYNVITRAVEVEVLVASPVTVTHMTLGGLNNGDDSVTVDVGARIYPSEGDPIGEGNTTTGFGSNQTVTVELSEPVTLVPGRCT